MPFGLNDAPITFQRLMHTVLKNENWLTCLIYLNEYLIKISVSILVVCPLFYPKSRSLAWSYRLLSVIFWKQVSYLGHLVTEKSLKTDRSKINVIKNKPWPTTITELRSFLGFVNYYNSYWKFIESFSQMSGKLESLIKSAYHASNKQGSITNQWPEDHLSLIHIWRCRRSTLCRSRWSPYH